MNNQETLKRKQLLKEWKNETENFRIEAVIHDGQWYDIKKWGRSAKIKDLSLIEKWINDNQEILDSLDNSYRVKDAETIFNWYKKHNLNINDNLVPKNFPPKIWENKTEAQHYIDTPRRQVSNISVKCSDYELMKKVENLLSPYGYTIYNKKHDKLTVVTLSANFLHYLILRHFSDEELLKIKARVRNSYLRREIIDLDDDVVFYFTDFYTGFSLSVLQNHMKTLQMFLNSKDDIKSQIYEWIYKALQKFDETQPIPFSGYLNNVLQRWPYDLPNDELGPELSKYQRERSKAYNLLVKEKQCEPTFEMIKEVLLNDYTLDKINEYEEQHRKWINIRLSEDLSFKDSNRERSAYSIFTNEEDETSLSKRTSVLISIINTGIETECYQDALDLIENLSKDFNSKNMSKLSLKYRKAFQKKLANEFNL